MKVGALLLTLLLAMRVAMLEAHPFEPEPRLGLEELRADGDLELLVTLAKIPLDDVANLEVWAEHNLEALDYAVVRSRIWVCPARSSVAPWTENSVVWRKPNGARKILAKVQAGSHGRTVTGARASDKEAAIVYERGGTRAIAGGSAGTFTVHDEGWTLLYNASGLYRFLTPGGESYAVESSGGMIRTIRHGTQTLLEFRGAGGSDQTIATSDRNFHLRVGHDGEIQAIERGGVGLIAKFGYDSAGRVVEADLQGLHHQFSWRSIGSLDKHGIGWIGDWTLSRFDEKRFDYRITGKGLTLERSSAVLGVKRVELGVKYGSIISVAEHQRGPSP